MLTLFGSGILCELEVAVISEDESSQISPIDPAVWHSGHPVSKEYVHSSSSTATTTSSSSTEIETKQLMEAPEKEYRMPAVGSVAKERTCLVCEDVISSSLALVRHIKANYLDLCSCFCKECESSFNTMVGGFVYSCINCSLGTFSTLQDL